MLAAVVFVFGGERDVNRRQQAEHHYLYNAHKDAENHDWHGQQEHKQPGENREQKVVDSEVEEQPNRQRNRPEN